MTISFAHHQFPPAIIRHAVWLYVRITLSYRDIEDLLAERGLDVSYETVRRALGCSGGLPDHSRGPPWDSVTWRKVTETRAAGSPVWLPRVKSGYNGLT